MQCSPTSFRFALAWLLHHVSTAGNRRTQSRNVELSLGLDLAAATLSVERFSPAVSGLHARTNVRYVTCNPSPILVASNQATAIDYSICTVRHGAGFVS
jgi:hypothetical protein